MSIPRVDELVKKFKQRSIRQMLQNRDKLQQVKGSPMWKELSEAVDRAAVEPDRHWREHWEPGGEFHVPELILEDFTEYRSVDGDVKNMGPATVKPLDIIYVHPKAISMLISLLQTYDESLSTVADPVPLAAKLHMVAMMVAMLQDSAGQFVVYSMSFNSTSVSEHCWVVLYGDVCGLSECETAEEAQKRIREVRCNGLDRAVELRPGFLHWDYLKPFVNSRLVLPIERVEFTR